MWEKEIDSRVKSFMKKSLREILSENIDYKPHPDEMDEILYHTSQHDWDWPHPFTHFGTKRAARERHWGSGYKEKGPSFQYSVRLKKGKIAEIDDMHGEHKYHDILDSLYDHRHISREEYDDTRNQLWGGGNHVENAYILSKLLKQKGITALKYTNQFEHPGSKSYMNVTSNGVRVLRKGYGFVSKKRNRR